MKRKELIEKLQALWNDETEVKDLYKGNEKPDVIYDVTLDEDEKTIIINVHQPL